MSDLFAAAGAFTVALAALWVPGLIVLAVVRTGLVARLALAPVVSVVAIGIAGVVFGALGVPFAAWQVLVVAALGLLAAWVAGRRRIRFSTAPTGRWWIVVIWVAAAAGVGAVAYVGMGAVDAISQTFDNVFHLSAIAEILRSGDASTLTLRTLSETERTIGVYPAAWHSLVVLAVQSSGASIPIATNAAWLAVAVGAWLPGAAWLAQSVLVRANPRTVVAVAIPLAATAPAMPFVLLAWGTLYPTFLATALLPAAIAIPIVTDRVVRAVRRPERRAVLLWRAAGIAVTLLALFFAQGRVIATWALILAVPILWRIVSLWWRAIRAGGRARRTARRVAVWAAVALVVVAAAAFAVLVFRLGLFERPLEDRLGGPQALAVQTVWDGIFQIVTQSWLTGSLAATTAPLIALAIVTWIGVWAAARQPDLRWVVVAWAILAVLYILAAGSDSVVAKILTGIWYKDRYRLSSAIPTLGVVLATLGILVVAAWIRRRTARVSAQATAVTIALVVAASAGATLALTGTPAAIRDSFHTPRSHAVLEYVSHAQIEFFRRLPDVVPADQRVLGDPGDGSAWTLLLGDREAVFPHLHGAWDADRTKVAWFLDTIDEDHAVCEALDRLRVRYVVYSPHAFGGGDPSGNKFPAIHSAVERGLFTLVDTDGDTSLYRIDQCGPLD